MSWLKNLAKGIVIFLTATISLQIINIIGILALLTIANKGTSEAMQLTIAYATVIIGYLTAGTTTFIIGQKLLHQKQETE